MVYGEYYIPFCSAASISKPNAFAGIPFSSRGAWILDREWLQNGGFDRPELYIELKL
jgi:hypothetical protein